MQLLIEIQLIIKHLYHPFSVYNFEVYYSMYYSTLIEDKNWKIETNIRSKYHNQIS